MWTPLRARKRPARLADELHSLWEVEAETLEGYPDLVRLKVDYGEERLIRVVLNRSGQIVSLTTEEVE